MDFISLIFFLIIYYIRFQEWPGLLWTQRFQPVTLIMIFAIAATFLKNQSLRLRDFFKTPHDWLITIYCLWMVVTSPSPREVFHSVYPLYFFYIVTVQALSSMDRIRKFLGIWTLVILGLAILALASTWGFDPTGGEAITIGKMKGRLSLGTSLFNNPNALGHSLAPSILMLYFLLIWERPIFVKIGALPIFLLPLYCIFLTASKGTFLSGFATSVAALCFGRAKITQAIILVMAITIGWAAVKSLPRMHDMENARADGGIQGRLIVFKYGKECLEKLTTGLGKDRFLPSIERDRRIWKASHSSYVQIGSELGRPGFYLFMGVLFCSLRTLFGARTRNFEEERVRRTLFAMLAGYMISSWMVDFAYRASFFMMIAAIAAFHRMLLPKTELEDEQAEEEGVQPLPILRLGGIPASVTSTAALPVVMSQTIAQSTIDIPAAAVGTTEQEETTESPVGISWNKIGILDFILIAVMAEAAIRFWGYIMYHI